MDTEIIGYKENILAASSYYETKEFTQNKDTKRSRTAPVGNIDKSRLFEKRSLNGVKSYTNEELKAFVQAMGLKKSQRKRDLIETLRAALNV